MPTRSASLIFGSAVVLASVFATSARSAPQDKNTKEAQAPAPKREITGVWLYQGSAGEQKTAPEKDIAPITPSPQARVAAAKPVYVSPAVPVRKNTVSQ